MLCGTSATLFTNWWQWIDLKGPRGGPRLKGHGLGRRSRKFLAISWADRFVSFLWLFLFSGPFWTGQVNYHLGTDKGAWDAARDDFVSTLCYLSVSPRIPTVVWIDCCEDWGPSQLPPSIHPPSESSWSSRPGQAMDDTEGVPGRRARQVLAMMITRSVGALYDHLHLPVINDRPNSR